MKNIFLFVLIFLICSIAIKSNDQIRILHLSTRLITANYKLAKNGDWELTEEFRALSGANRNQKVNEVIN